MKLYPALTQTALNLAAKNPKSHPELRQMRAQIEAAREKELAAHKSRMAEMDGFIARVGIALGEVAA